MGILTIIRLLGLFHFITAALLLVPLLFELNVSSLPALCFIKSAGISALVGFLAWFPTRHYHDTLKLKSSFLVVSLIWISFCWTSALPFYFFSPLNLNFISALFEATSGVTTTGSTTLSYFEWLPQSILFYRQFIQYMGGLGIIILVVAIMPFLGVGGMKLFQLESTGPLTDNKLTPRIKDAAKAFWYIYLWLTFACFWLFKLSGMSWFDAMCYSFSVVSTGGFAPHSDSIGHFNSLLIMSIASLFMILSAVSYPLHYVARRHKLFMTYLKDEEFKTFIYLILLFITVAIAGLVITNNQSVQLSNVIFTVISCITSTGLTTEPLNAFPGGIPMLFLVAAIIGGCAGSTAGGIKVIRYLLLKKQITHEIKKLLHPHAYLRIRLNRVPLPEGIIKSVWAFLSLYIFLFFTLLVVLLCFESDFLTAFSTLLATYTNLGPALGSAAYDYGHLSDPALAILSFAMLIGRLEVFSLFILLTPYFWKK